MDSTQRISERGRPVYLTSKQPKVNQTTEAIVSVSEDRSVSKEQREKVGGVSADRKASLNRYKELLDGKTLPAMTQLMGADKAEEEPAARKALEKPSLDKDMTQPADKNEDAVGKVDSENSEKTKIISLQPNTLNEVFDDIRRVAYGLNLSELTTTSLIKPLEKRLENAIDLFSGPDWRCGRFPHALDVSCRRIELEDVRRRSFNRPSLRQKT